VCILLVLITYIQIVFLLRIVIGCYCSKQRYFYKSISEILQKISLRFRWVNKNLVSFPIYDNVLFFFRVWIFPHPSTFSCCGEPRLDVCTIRRLANCELSCFHVCNSCIDVPSGFWPQYWILLSQLVIWSTLVLPNTFLNTVLSVVSNICSAL
jgi:hypothetical protein